MKKITVKSLLVICCCLLSFTIFSQEYSKNELIIEFEEGTTDLYIEKTLAKYGGIEKNRIKYKNVEIVLVSFKIPNSIIIGEGIIPINSILDLLEIFECDLDITKTSGPQRVKATDLNYIISSSPLGNNTNTNYDIGNYNPSPNCKGDFISKGFFEKNKIEFPTKIKVAIIDAGLRPIDNLTDLINWNESYDFVDGGNVSTDSRSAHGTRVYSVIRGIIGNQNTNISIVSIRTLGEDGTGTLFNLYQSMIYAIEIESDIINLSLTAPMYEPDECTIIMENILNLAEEKEVLVVAASGNDSTNIDSTFYIPASCTNHNLLVAGSSNCTNSISRFSNVGNRNVDIMTNGERVLTFDGQVYGTSFAAPQVTGIAALKWATIESLDYLDVKRSILETATDMRWNEHCSTGGILNPEAVFERRSRGRNSKLQEVDALSINSFFTKESLQVSIESPSEGEAQIAIFSITGRQVKTQNIYVQNSENTIHLKGVDTLPPGIYIVKTAVAGQVLTQKCYKAQ